MSEKSGMKRILGILVLLSCCFFKSEAQNREVNFEELTYQEALAKAKAENKLVFLDAYTSWCGPCKMMLNTVFREDVVADYMNSRFVCIKMDMEKGEGPALRQQYGISSYPTYLFLNGEAKVEYRTTGASPAKVFLEKIEKGLDPNTSLSGMGKRYANGERDDAFLMNYISLLRGASEFKQLGGVGRAYLESLPEKERFSKEVWNLYRDYYVNGGAKGEVFQYIVEHKQQFADVVGENEVNDCLYGIPNGYIFGYLAGRACPSAEEKDCRQMIESYALPKERKQALQVLLEMGKARSDKDFGQLLKLFDKKLDLIPDNEHYRVLLQLKCFKEQGTPAQKAKAVAILKKAMEKEGRPDYFVEGLGMIMKELQ